MKKIILPIVMLALLSFGIIDSKLTDAERELAASEMAASKDQLLHSLEGLSENQLNFKNDPTSWSVAECVEHLAISESMIFGMLQSTLESPADASRRSEVKMTDEMILAAISDRTNKVKTSKPFEPSGKFGSYEATLKEFVSKRDEHIAYVKSTQDDLRNRYQELPFGVVDSFQILLFMSSHTERHIKQIHEIMQSKNFPKS